MDCHQAALKVPGHEYRLGDAQREHDRLVPRPLRPPRIGDAPKISPGLDGGPSQLEFTLATRWRDQRVLPGRLTEIMKPQVKNHAMSVEAVHVAAAVRGTLAARCRRSSCDRAVLQ